MPDAVCARTRARASRSRDTRPAAIAAGQNRLPGRANPTPASAEWTLGLSPHTNRCIPGPTVSGRVRARVIRASIQKPSPGSTAHEWTSKPAPTSTSVNASAVHAEK